VRQKLVPGRNRTPLSCRQEKSQSGSNKGTGAALSATTTNRPELGQGLSLHWFSTIKVSITLIEPDHDSSVSAVLARHA
jgi:hypothetical protein